MRRLLGWLFLLAAAFFFYQFGIWGGYGAGADLKTYGSAVAFRMLGSNYPFDVGMLAGAVWAIGLGTYLVLSAGSSGGAVPAHVPSTSKWAQRLASRQGQSSPMAAVFMLNACALATMLFCAYIGAKSSTDHARTVSIFSLVAVLQVATGLLLLILALFEKPKGPVALMLGSAVYLAGTAVTAVVFLWGQSASQT